jgi:tRNA(Ile)-lysidine synthase
MPATRRLASEPEIILARPFLGVTRHAIRDYLAELKQPFREDESNIDLSRTRARIRHDLLPKLAAEYNPSVALAVVRLGSLASSLERAIETDLRKFVRSAVITNAPECVVLKHGFLQSLPRFVRTEVLRRVWRHAGWPEASMSAQRWRRLAALILNDEFPRVQVGAHVEVSTDRSFLVLRRLSASETSAAAAAAVAEGPTPLEVPGLTPVAWASGVIEARINPGPEMAGYERIDLDEAVLPLFVRRPAAGDRFAPLGMAGKSMPLSDFFRGRQVPRAGRAITPLVCDADGIIWVIGHRISDRVKVTEQTRRTLELRWGEDAG